MDAFESHYSPDGLTRIALHYDEFGIEPHTDLRFVIMSRNDYRFPNETRCDDGETIRSEAEELKGGEKGIIKPFYQYQHSGVAISLGREYPFNCPWDSGCAGLVVLPHDVAEDTPDPEAYLAAAFSEIASYVAGECFGSTKETRNPDDLETWENVDSCWGFYGTPGADHHVFESAGVSPDEFKKWTEDDPLEDPD